MEKYLLDIIDKRQSAVVGNLNVAMANNIVDFLDIKEYPYIILSSSTTMATHRIGFPNGINEYTGSEVFIRMRLKAEMKLINQTFDLNIDDYFLDYTAEWIYNLHVMNTPINYLDLDGVLFETLEMYFQERNQINPNIEDQVANKLMALIKEFFIDDNDLPIVQFRVQLFSNPCVVIIVEDSFKKANYIIDSIKLYHHDFKILEANSDLEQVELQYISLNN